MDNIFCIGTQVRGDSFIGRKKELVAFRNAFLESRTKTAKSIIGLTRTGKSSFVDNAFLNIPEEAMVLYVNIILGDLSYYSMWQWIMLKLKKQLKRKKMLDDELEELLEIFDEDDLKWVKLNHAVKDIFEYLCELGFKVILVFDEFDKASYVFENDTKKYDMFRELISSPKYSIYAVTVSRRNLYTIEGTTYQSSTLHGVLETIYFKGFSSSDIDEFYSVLGKYDIFLTAEQKKEIEYYAGNSPYLLSIFGNKLVERKKAGKSLDINDVFHNDCKLINDYYRDVKKHLERDNDLSRLLPFVIGPNIGVTRNDHDELMNLGYLLVFGNRTIALSEYFTQLLSIDMINLNIWESIISVEKKIKQIIEREKVGLVDYYQVYGESIKDIEREILRNTPGTRSKLLMFDAFIDSTRNNFFKECSYFDVMSLGDSFNIIGNAWSIFSKYFRDTQYNEWCLKFDKCAKARNPIAHGHEEYISETEKKEVDVYCKLILDSIGNVISKVQQPLLSEAEIIKKARLHKKTKEDCDCAPKEMIFYGEQIGQNNNLKGSIIDGEYKGKRGSISKLTFDKISKKPEEFIHKKIIVSIVKENPQNTGYILNFIKEA